MKVIIVGDSCEGLVLGNIFRRSGAIVDHFIPTKRYLRYKVDRVYDIDTEHYYPKDQEFKLLQVTKDVYRPTFTNVIEGQPELIVFAGCYDEVVTGMKQFSTIKARFPKSKYLIQIKNWKSVEYLETIVGSNATAWITPMVEAYFDDTEERKIRAGFIRKIGMSFTETSLDTKKTFAKEIADLIGVDIFEVSDTIHINRIVISAYTPFVLYMTRFMEMHWKNQTKVLKYLRDYFVETRPFLFEYIQKEDLIKDNLGEDMWPYINLFKHTTLLDMQKLITRMASQTTKGLFAIMVRAALINKYSNDEAVDLATEMIRWFRYYKIKINSLLSLFDNQREIWEYVDILAKARDEAKYKPKTLLLERIENKNT